MTNKKKKISWIPEGTEMFNNQSNIISFLDKRGATLKVIRVPKNERRQILDIIMDYLKPNEGYKVRSIPINHYETTSVSDYKFREKCNVNGFNYDDYERTFAEAISYVSGTTVKKYFFKLKTQ